MLTIIGPASSHRLTTLEKIKGELRLSGEADDEYLTDLIDQASDAVRSWCGRTFALEGLRETLILRQPAESIMLSRWPITSIDAVTIAGQAVDPSGFEAEADSGFVYRLGPSCERAGWPCGRIVVDYQAGYVLPGEPDRTLPRDVERAVITLVRGEVFARTRDPRIRSEDVNGVTNTTYWVGGFGNGATLPPDVEGLLSKHRQPVIG